MTLLELFVAFLASFLVGAFAIFVAAIIVVNDWEPLHAVVSALVGGVLWTTATGIGHVVALVLVLVAWIIALNVIYRGDWRHAAVLGFFAWACAFLVLVSLQAFLPFEFGIFGIPGL